MTLLVTISNPDETASKEAVVVGTDGTSFVVKPGGKADFYIHDSKHLVVIERPVQKD